MGDLYLVYLYNMVIFHSELLVYHDLDRMAPPSYKLASGELTVRPWQIDRGWKMSFH